MTQPFPIQFAGDEPEERGFAEMLAAVIEIYEDGCMPYDCRTYASGAWAEILAEAKAMLAKESQ